MVSIARVRLLEGLLVVAGLGALPAVAPPERYSPAFGVDAARKELVLFGGHSASGDLADTWIRGAAGWQPQVGAAPSARNWPQLVAAPGGGLLLFGGDVRLAAFGDSWRFDGRAWSRLEVAGPAARSLHRMAFDAKRERVVLFGGRDRAQWFTDTWEFDGKAWRDAKASGPAARQLFAMAWDGEHGVVVLFGGTRQHADRPTGDDLLGDTWEFDGKAWQEVAAEGPSPRDHVAMAWDAARKRVVLFGGGHPVTGTLGDTWLWDGAEWNEAKTESPGVRAGHSMAWDPATERVVLFGGFDATGPKSDLWAWDGAKWARAD